MFAFKPFDFLAGDEIDLEIVMKLPGSIDRGYSPAYHYRMLLHGTTTAVGRIDLRIGESENLYYGGNIGYTVYESYRGRKFAAKACRMLKPVARAHGLQTVSITCNPDNLPSRRTCELLGAKLQAIVDLPPHNEMYLDGERQKCIYEWTISPE